MVHLTPKKVEPPACPARVKSSHSTTGSSQNQQVHQIILQTKRYTKTVTQKHSQNQQVQWYTITFSKPTGTPKYSQNQKVHQNILKTNSYTKTFSKPTGTPTHSQNQQVHQNILQTKKVHQKATFNTQWLNSQMIGCFQKRGP